MTTPDGFQQLPPLHRTPKKRAVAWNGKGHRRQVQERAGWTLYEDVERRFFNMTHDYLGFGDLQLFHPMWGWCLEQVTVKSKLAEHVKDALANKKLGPRWLRHGWLIQDLRAVRRIPFAARIVAYPDAPARKLGDFAPRIVPIVLGPDGQLHAEDYP